MKKFQSRLGQYMYDMILYQEALGYSAVSYEYYFRKLDKFLYTQFPNADALTQELIQIWIKTLHSVSRGCIARHLTILRLFARYLKSIGLQAYVLPQKMVGYKKNPSAHIYSPTELKSFFYGADHIESSAKEM